MTCLDGDGLGTSVKTKTCWSAGLAHQSAQQRVQSTEDTCVKNVSIFFVTAGLCVFFTDDCLEMNPCMRSMRTEQKIVSLHDCTAAD